MDHAVALVQAYLQVNGYFTVAEYPVLEALEAGGYQAATDIDLLALRLCDAGGVLAAGAGRDRAERFEPDPELRVPRGSADLLIVEVKEGRAELNPSARNAEILSAVLTRFGLAPHPRMEKSVAELQRTGRTKWPGDIWVRLLAFGSLIDPKSVAGFQAISLPHVTRFLSDYLHENWEALRHAHIRHQGFGFLALLEQIRRADRAPPG